MLLADITRFDCVYVETIRKWMKCTCFHFVQATVAAMQVVDGTTRTEAESMFVNRCWGRPDVVVHVCFRVSFIRTVHVCFRCIACITCPLSYADCSSFPSIAVFVCLFHCTLSCSLMYQLLTCFILSVFPWSFLRFWRVALIVNSSACAGEHARRVRRTVKVTEYYITCNRYCNRYC